MRQLSDTPVTKLAQISAKRAALLAKLGVENLLDLLFFFPRNYDDWTSLTPLHLIQNGETVTTRAEIVLEPTLQRRGNLSWLKTQLRDEVTTVSAIWFNQPWLRQKLRPGQVYYFRGAVQRQGRGFSLQNPLFLTEEAYREQGILANYRLTKGLNQAVIRQAVDQVLTQIDQALIDPLPDALRKRERLVELEFALRRIHQPKLQQDIVLARERLAFEELFLIRLALYQIKYLNQNQGSAQPLTPSAKAREKMEALRADLPFRPTRSQMTAINDILRDLRRDRPMNRLLQGDVGSGKTLVAAFALAYTAWCGRQSMFMAPTSILAKQHYATLSHLLEPAGVRLALLTGSTKAAERRRILEAALNGELDVLIGTHALLQDDVQMRELALTITDEQHRFGVNQRTSIYANDGRQTIIPHRLVMSATPIPRTLGLILYGDLDLSIMRELPAGRKPIRTYLAGNPDRPRLIRMMRETMRRGEQVYLVCPLIEESESSPLESAEMTYREMCGLFKDEFKVGLIHGSLKVADKDEIMERFTSGEIRLLVSTTVIEVGVDNPRATLMLIENAERFGLAQLHQLRGRIGRGERASICVLISDTEDQLARKRLKLLCRTNDGFELAEQDLALRGPGDFFGTRQHGLPQFRLLNLYEDQALIEAVERSIEEIAAADPELQTEEHRRMLTALNQRYPELVYSMTL